MGQWFTRNGYVFLNFDIINSAGAPCSYIFKIVSKKKNILNIKSEIGYKCPDTDRQHFFNIYDILLSYTKEALSKFAGHERTIDD